MCIVLLNSIVKLQYQLIGLSQQQMDIATYLRIGG